MPGTLDDMMKDMAKAREELEALAKATPRIIGIEAVRVVKENFVKQGYDSGNGFTPWAKRKASTNKAYSRNRGAGQTSNFKGSVFSASKPILRQTNNLYDSINYKVSSGGVFIGVNLLLVPYARAHNEGLSINRKARTSVIHFKGGRFSTASSATHAQKANIGAGSFKMPKRQYMPLPGEKGNPKILKAAKTVIDFKTAQIMKRYKK